MFRRYISSTYIQPVPAVDFLIFCQHMHSDSAISCEIRSRTTKVLMDFLYSTNSQAMIIANIRFCYCCRAVVWLFSNLSIYKNCCLILCQTQNVVHFLFKFYEEFGLRKGGNMWHIFTLVWQQGVKIWVMFNSYWKMHWFFFLLNRKKVK